MSLKKSIQQRIQKLLNANNTQKVANIKRVEWVKRVSEGK